MNNVLILLAAVGLSCVLVAHGSPTIGLLTAFGALRASSIQSKRRFHGPGYGRYHGHGYKAPRRKYRLRYGRSVQTDTDADENLLLSIVEHVDPEGCIPKTLCLLEAKDESDRSPDEAQLLEVFANNTRGLTSPNAAFVHAAQVGAQTRDSSACDRLFAKCSLDEDQLSEVLHLSWSCDCDSEEKQDAPSS